MVAPGSTRRQTKNFLRQCAIGFCSLVLRLGSRPFVLRDEPAVVIAPHQDDETLGCGGLIARKRNEGLPVHVIFITDGSASHPQHTRLSPAAIATLRVQEARQAVGQLGVERTAVHFLDEPDATLKAITADRRENLVARLAALLESITPGEIFLPCQPDGSSEHDASVDFVLEAVARTTLHPDLWQYPVWSWWNPLLLLQGWLTTDDCRRQEVEDFLPAKRAAIACYQSQIAPLAPDSAPALPSDLVAIFSSDTEYFFRRRIPEPAPPRSA
jgi:LmbE family N-acetylglucosaminyl deacetylase